MPSSNNHQRWTAVCRVCWNRQQMPLMAYRNNTNLTLPAFRALGLVVKGIGFHHQGRTLPKWLRERRHPGAV